MRDATNPIPPARPEGDAAEDQTGDHTGDHAEGLPAGALVLTLEGERPIETLMPGERIIAYNSGTARLKELELLPGPHAPVCIRAGALGEFRPASDAVVGAGTRVQLHGESKFRPPPLPAFRLIDGGMITRGALAPLALYRPRFHHQEVIYAGGLLLAF
ncbi:Hint domain-containing protein [Pseudoroseicyclus sp. CXY001]|uniref:Hint domain-containing protein n=1 Tax=Pseudoroseicyclus sp. CXY001 TaxID=3242492 RepID=UPI0035710449